jgi:hypothetical protein
MLGMLGFSIGGGLRIGDAETRLRDAQKTLAKEVQKYNEARLKGHHSRAASHLRLIHGLQKDIVRLQQHIRAHAAKKLSTPGSSSVAYRPKATPAMPSMPGPADLFQPSAFQPSSPADLAPMAPSAAASTATSQTYAVAEETPFYMRPVVILGGLVVLGAGVYFATRKDKKDKKDKAEKHAA